MIHRAYMHCLKLSLNMRNQLKMRVLSYHFLIDKLESKNNQPDIPSVWEFVS